MGFGRWASYARRVLRRTFKFRLYPTRRQERLLLDQLRFTRELYNAALEQRIAAYEATAAKRFDTRVIA